RAIQNENAGECTKVNIKHQLAKRRNRLVESTEGCKRSYRQSTKRARSRVKMKVEDIKYKAKEAMEEGSGVLEHGNPASTAMAAMNRKTPMIKWGTRNQKVFGPREYPGTYSMLLNQSCEENEDSGCMRTFGRPWQRQGNSWYYAQVPKPLLRENFAWLCNVMVQSKLRRDLRQVLQIKIVFSPMRWVATLQGRSSSYMTVASANIGMQFYTNATQEPWVSAGFLFEWQQRTIVEGGMDPLAARKHFLGGLEDEFQDVEGHRNRNAIFTAMSVFLSLTIYSGNSTLRGSPEAGPNTAELNLAYLTFHVQRSRVHESRVNSQTLGLLRWSPIVFGGKMQAKHAFVRCHSPPCSSRFLKPMNVSSKSHIRDDEPEINLHRGYWHVHMVVWNILNQ
ncbi:hypothetical protein EV421DRAFT_1945900, partial [Armillaria borealis]